MSGGDWKQASAPFLNIESVLLTVTAAVWIFSCKILQGKKKKLLTSVINFLICIAACPLCLCGTAFAD